MLKEGALAAAARAQAVRGVRAPHVGEAAGGDLAAGSHPEPGWILHLTFG